MNNDFKAGIIGGLVFLGILLCLGLVENTLESSSDKKHLHIADIHIHQIMEHQRAVLIQVEVVHQENHQVQQVLLSIQEPNRLLQEQINKFIIKKIKFFKLFKEQFKKEELL